MNCKTLFGVLAVASLCVGTETAAMARANDYPAPVRAKALKASSASIDMSAFLAQHDMYWTTITADPTAPSADGNLRTGYYAGAIMGNGLLGTNLYKLTTNVYRLNVGRSDVTEARQPYNLYNSARLPIGYFTLATVGNVKDEKMRLSLYDAATTGTLTTDVGRIRFHTYVHATQDCIVFETTATGREADYAWNFVPQQAISPRQIFNKDAPKGYLNAQGKSNPDPLTKEEDGIHYLIQPLVSDNTFSTIVRTYVVAWAERREGDKRRIVATVAQEKTADAACTAARKSIQSALSVDSSVLETSHRKWWHDFYSRAAFLTFPDARIESFYWAQYYKFASTARMGKPVVDLQGVWPTWDTPWTAIWMNLNLQLTYSWQTKANLQDLAQPLWEALYDNRYNLQRNVTDIKGQETWTDARVLPRTATYDFHSPLDPATANSNQYEVGNLTWTLFYYYQQCMATADTIQLRERLFPLLKSAVNVFFHIRTKQGGRYGLPPTASPEYVNTSIGTNANYDLANLRWGLRTLLEVDSLCHIGDTMRPQWRDFLDNLVDYPYSATTGFKVSDKYEFTNTSHRHYSHLFMLYPYHLLDWETHADSIKMALSLNRWNGNQGYSRTGKAAMLLSRGDGNGALTQMQTFFNTFIKPNTLYAETGPVIETPFAAVSTLHEFYLQDWGNKIRVFYGMPTSWQNAAFIRMRARGAFLVSATRKNGHTVFVQVESEHGGKCHLQTEIPLANLTVADTTGKAVPFTVISPATRTIAFDTKPGDVIVLTDNTLPAEAPIPIAHSAAETFNYGDGNHSVPLKRLGFKSDAITVRGTNVLLPDIVTEPAEVNTGALVWNSGDSEVLASHRGFFEAKGRGRTWISVSTADGELSDTCRVSVEDTDGERYVLADADTYVYDGNKTGNYGWAGNLVIKNDAAGYQRNAYYRFVLPDYNTLPDDFRAFVSLYITGQDRAAHTVSWVLKAANGTWNEQSINWNNKPALMETIATVPGRQVTTDYAPGNRLVVDVTAYVKKLIAAHQNVFSFNINQSTRAQGGAGTAYLASKENEDGRKFPFLILRGKNVSTDIAPIAITTPISARMRYFTPDGIEVVHPVAGQLYIATNGRCSAKVIYR